MSTPYCTYRIQLHSGFRFRDLASILDYLHELGISTIYSSPVSTAFKGSTHGYDVTDPLTLSSEIGTLGEFERLAGRLKEYGMNWLQDIVPNHMAYTAANPWLYDVLERGKISPYYSFFDIDTDHPEEAMTNKLMAPFLGKTLTECLQQGEIKLDFGERGFIRKIIHTEQGTGI